VSRGLVLAKCISGALKTALMERVQCVDSQTSQLTNPYSFFPPLFIMVFVSNGFVCYPLHYEDHCLTKRIEGLRFDKVLCFGAELMVLIHRGSDLICGGRRFSGH
jgi:hypothetical protein